MTAKGRGGKGASGVSAAGFVRMAVCVVLLLGILLGLARLLGIHNVNDLVRWAQGLPRDVEKVCDMGAVQSGGLPDCHLPTGEGAGSSSGAAPDGVPQIGVPGAGSGSGAGGSQGGGVSDGGGAQAGATATAQQLKSALDSLEVREPDTSAKYSRGDWKHWVPVDGACNTREAALRRDGTDVVVDAATCKPTSGTWFDPYSGETFSNAKQMDIDHLIPLMYAQQHGGAAWSSEKKREYANDLDTVLVTVSAKENRAKGAKGPGEYMPPREEYHCEYAQRWIAISQKYGLWISKDDKSALESAIGKCG